MKLVDRSGWNARGPKSVTRITSTRGVKVHYTGGHVDPKMLTDHGRCDDAVRGIQNGHMDGNGWVDVGYSMLVCPHRYVYMGRGPNVLCSANGAGLNTAHYAVLGLVGNSGVTKPTDDMLHGIVDAIEYLREHGGAGKEIKGHRDGYATDCPGEALYAWVQRGAPRPASSSPAANPTSKEDDVPEIVSIGARADQKVPAGGVLVVNWRQEWTDTGADHAAESPHIKVEAGYWAICDGLIKLHGFTPGEQVDIAWSRFKADGKTLKDDAWAVTYTADLNGRVEASIGGQFQLDSTVLGCLRIVNGRPYEVVLEKVSMAKLALFKR